MAAKRLSTDASPRTRHAGTGRVNPFQLVGSGDLELEQSAQQILGGLTDENGVGCGQRLQPRGEIGCFADDGSLLRGAAADDFAHHDEAGGNSDSRLRWRIVRQLDTADFRQDGDRRANGPFRGIFKGERKAEIGQDAIAHELGDEAAISSDRARSGILIAPDQTSEKLGIDFAR